ncbi:hypothetical protein [Longimicrobium sp.]|uniref:hypothetical protein n=1 Tax=Longimicrobium sp. TaxID=2029185 RepID=UPI002C172F79|nr:hypothetical protein [Longimicrobium sp.]HSU13123.1 hypothetical protein [Longimicrobium sp.]
MAAHSSAKIADMHEQVMHECASMARYALASGMKLSPSLMSDLEKIRRNASPGPAEMAALVRIHSQLVVLVAPATPRALLVLGDEDHASTRFAWLGHVGVVRRMMLVAAVSVALFLGVSITKELSDPTISLLAAAGWQAVAVEVWWVSAAAMGASFAMLMQVSDYIVKRTYDPKHEPGYWIRFLLGIMAGLILAALIPVPKDSTFAELGKPTLAMLGGFSASAVYRILMRMVDTVESLFRPSAKDEIAQRERAAQVRANEENSQSRVALAGQIVRLQQRLSTGAGAADITSELQTILNGLVPQAAPADADAPPATTIAVGNIPIVGAPGSPDDAQAPATASSEDENAPAANDSGATVTVSATTGDGDASAAEGDGATVTASASATTGDGDAPAAG